MRFALPKFARLSACIMVCLLSAPPPAVAQDKAGIALAGRLSSDFDALVVEAREAGLSRLDRATALFLIDQEESFEGGAGLWFSESFAGYHFEGRVEDLRLFAEISASSSQAVRDGYCRIVMKQIDRTAPDTETCMARIGTAFIRQRGEKIPAGAFTPEILDRLYHVTRSGETLLPGSFGPTSLDRLRAYAAREGNEQLLSKAPAAFANASPCTSEARAIPALAGLEALCKTGTISTEVREAAEEFDVLSAVLAICEEEGLDHRCWQDLLTLHSIAGACERPVLLEVGQDWYGSRLFKTCLAGFLS